jgi:dihydroorotate dehydrogenase electron transfer subunit
MGDLNNHNSDVSESDLLFCLEREVWSGEGVVVRNEQIADKTFRLSIAVDDKFPIAQSGQFIMVRLAVDVNLLLGIPLAIYKVDRNSNSFGGCDVVDVIYLVAGNMTSRFAQLTTNTRIRMWGPLGRGFEVDFLGHTILIAGGVGHVPFLMLAEKLKRATLLYGAKNAARVVPLDDFVKAGVDVKIATDDGSLGIHGFVTELINQVYQQNEPTRILCCGPAQMMKATFEIAKKLELPCTVSLETPMSCGIGICYGCVVKVKDKNNPNGWNYKRTCIDGPAFDAYDLIF